MNRLDVTNTKMRIKSYFLTVVENYDQKFEWTLQTLSNQKTQNFRGFWSSSSIFFNNFGGWVIPPNMTSPAWAEQGSGQKRLSTALIPKITEHAHFKETVQAGSHPRVGLIRYQARGSRRGLHRPPLDQLHRGAHLPALHAPKARRYMLLLAQARLLHLQRLPAHLPHHRGLAHHLRHRLQARAEPAAHHVHHPADEHLVQVGLQPLPANGLLPNLAR